MELVVLLGRPPLPLPRPFQTFAFTPSGFESSYSVPNLSSGRSRRRMDNEITADERFEELMIALISVRFWGVDESVSNMRPVF